MKLRILFLSAMLTVFLVGSSVRAGYTFEFTDSNGNSTGNVFTVGVGQTVDINLYLAQTGLSTGLTTVGLQSGGVQLNTSTPSISTVTSVTPNTLVNGGQFDTGTSATGANAYATVKQAFDAPVVAPTTGTNANRILLGEFAFTGVSAGSTLTVTAVPSTGAAVNVLGDGTNLDSMLGANPVSASITVYVTPEPGTIALTAIGALIMGGATWYRRRRLT